MNVNVVLVGDHIKDPIEIQNKDDDVDVSVSSALNTYIYQYKHCLNALVSSSELTKFDNDHYTTFSHKKDKYYIIIPKTNYKSNLFKLYQRILPATNVLIYFVNINEQKNYSFDTLKKWDTSLFRKNNNGQMDPSNSQHVYRSYQLFQRMLIGIPHFIYPPKYLCIVLCCTQSIKYCNDKIVN